MVDVRGVIMMRMIVMNMTRQRVFAQIAPHQKNHPERQDHDPGYQSQPGIKLFRHDVLRSIESDRAEQIHARGVRRGDDQAEQQRMLERAARADEIRRDQSLAVSRLKGVKRAKTDGNGQAPAERFPSRDASFAIISVNELRGVVCLLAAS